MYLRVVRECFFCICLWDGGGAKTIISIEHIILIYRGKTQINFQNSSVKSSGSSNIAVKSITNICIYDLHSVMGANKRFLQSKFNMEEMNVYANKEFQKKLNPIESVPVCGVI